MRRLQWRFVRRAWRQLLGLVLFALFTTAALLAFIDDAFGRGLILGAMLTGTFASLFVLVMQMTGTAPRSMGASAEQWTASELRPLRKSGWRVVNHVALRPWDIDHVLVGPGGVFAVETKWSARPWSLEPMDERVIAAAAQAGRNARDLRLWQPLSSRAVRSVIPVVFLWGRLADGQDDTRRVRRLNDVVIVAGSQGAKEWRAEVTASEHLGGLDAPTVEAIWEDIDTQVRRRDAREQEEAPSPPSFTRLWWTGTAMLVASVLGFSAIAQAFTLADRIWIWAAVAGGVVVPGIVASRVPALRLYAASWLAGIVGALAFAGATILNAVLT